MKKTAIKELNILITGVGGQGVIMLSEILGEAIVDEGLKVRGSEVLGMAVRGGSVFSNLRIGEDVYGPLTPVGKCDVMLAMEPTEAIRNLIYLSKQSTVILNTNTIEPFTCALGQSTYPSLSEILNALVPVVDKIYSVDLKALAMESGSLQSSNIVMLGALFGTGKMPISADKMKEIIKSRFPSKTLAANLKAFDLGYSACN